MELRQLRYFIAVSHLGSVTGAAEQCHVAQPAISIAIRNPGEELGVQLFDRGHKKISLTATGQVFLRRAEDIVDRVGYSIKEMDDYRKLERGVIRLGVTPMLGAILFPYIMSRFRADFPHLELQVVEDDALTSKSLLEEGELDVGILAVPEKWGEPGRVPRHSSSARSSPADPTIRWPGASGSRCRACATNPSSCSRRIRFRAGSSSTNAAATASRNIASWRPGRS